MNYYNDKNSYHDTCTWINSNAHYNSIYVYGVKLTIKTALVVNCRLPFCSKPCCSNERMYVFDTFTTGDYGERQEVWLIRHKRMSLNIQINPIERVDSNAYLSSSITYQIMPHLLIWFHQWLGHWYTELFVKWLLRYRTQFKKRIFKFIPVTGKNHIRNNMYSHPDSK